jgi:hypothetical protein
MLAAATQACQTGLFFKIKVLLKKSQVWREFRHTMLRNCSSSRGFQPEQ